MLRITLRSRECSRTFVLKGRLTGLWAKELLRVARSANQSGGNTFDLEDVFFVDSAGERALRILSGFGATFIVESAYGKDLCRRLKLRRVSASDLKNEQQRAADSLHLENSQTEHDDDFAPMTMVSERLHPAGCRE